MENDEEAFRLDIKTDPEAVREQALWCGVKPGLRILDVGCGPGKTTSILREMVQPRGHAVGIDFSAHRIQKAKEIYGNEPGIDFEVCDFTKPMRDGLCNFDLIWIRFVLEYHAKESPDIIRNITDCLKPGGYFCLLDLDHNCLNHYELPRSIEKILFQIIDVMQKEYNFDPYIGRKLYSFLYDLGYENITMDMKAHHLIYGKVKAPDLFNWTKKLEMASRKAANVFDPYPGGHKQFFADFIEFFNDPRRFTYTPLILCKGIKSF
jgi:ubiquinone/menaquinone biosynthesis C-methylase UbiE